VTGEPSGIKRLWQSPGSLVRCPLGYGGCEARSKRITRQISARKDGTV
jgi:hypothetical protein